MLLPEPLGLHLPEIPLSKRHHPSSAQLSSHCSSETNQEANTILKMHPNFLPMDNTTFPINIIKIDHILAFPEILILKKITTMQLKQEIKNKGLQFKNLTIGL